MTVKQLKEELEKYPDDMEVVEYMGEPIDEVIEYCDSHGVEKCKIS